MEFLNLLREDPVIAWLVFLGILITVVPVASVIWRKMSGRQIDMPRQPVQKTRPVRFGNRTELILVFVGLVLLLALIRWIYVT